LPQTIWGNISGFYRILVQYFVHDRMFILVLPHKENKLHPIYRTIKSQDNFTERSQYERLFPAFVLHYKQKQLTLQSNKQRDY
jgi:inorganic diphosphatase